MAVCAFEIDVDISAIRVSRKIDQSNLITIQTVLTSCDFRLPTAEKIARIIIVDSAV